MWLRYTHRHTHDTAKKEVNEEKDEKVYLFRQKLFCVISSSEADARKCVLLYVREVRNNFLSESISKHW